MNASPQAPLAGIRVVDLTGVGPGQFCTRFLADMGADVITIEAPSRAPLGGEQNQRSPYLTRKKRSLTLNLKAAEGQKVLHALVRRSDVLVEGMRPGVVRRLAADYETLSELNPLLVYCSMSGYGQDGPYAQLAGHDLNYVALAGFLRADDGLPDVPANVLADYAGASMHAVAGILLALVARERVGVGQHVDVSYLDSTVALLGATTAFRQYAEQDRVEGPGEGVFSGRFPYYAVYATADRPITIGCLEPWLWRNLCIAVGAPELVDAGFTPEDLQRAPTEAQFAAHRRLQEIFLSRGCEAWFAELAEHDVCVAPVNGLEDVFRDPHLVARGMVKEHVDVHGRTTRELGVPIVLSATPGTGGGPVPARGQHSAEILDEIGLNEAQVDALVSAGVTTTDDY